MKEPITPPTLGSPRAEADPFLEEAFVETTEYRSLLQSRHYNFVVGRRGSGKSALFSRLQSAFASDSRIVLFAEKPSDYETLEFQDSLSQLPNYQLMQATSRLAWRGHMYLAIAERLLQAFLEPGSPDWMALERSLQPVRAVLAGDPRKRHLQLLGLSLSAAGEGKSAPGKLAETLRIEQLQSSLDALLRARNLSAMFLFDGLDEGWAPESAGCAFLGGLTHAIGAHADSHLAFHGIVFVRDNMFRALSHFDQDYSRHILGSTLRLTWDLHSLLQLVSGRLRLTSHLKGLENDIKIWNRCTCPELHEVAGFGLCLDQTLYRPRDILVLLNEAFLRAAHQSRSELSLEDVTSAGSSVASERLLDLLKEYEAVLPGLKSFIYAFEGRAAVSRIGSVLALFEQRFIEARSPDPAGEGDFALLGSANEVVWALYAIGFLGIKQAGEDRYSFCHDGTAESVRSVESSREVIVHPGFWRALNISSGPMEPEDSQEVFDEYEVTGAQEVRDLRAGKIGEIVGELERIPQGSKGAAAFEKWCMRVSQVLFSGPLLNFELKPNPGKTHQRDVVATNQSNEGFWRRILEDYHSRQVIFEAKNYSDLSADDFQQLLSYSTGVYGNFAAVIVRTDEEGVSTGTRQQLKFYYHEHGRVFLILPVGFLVRCLAKVRRKNRFDYAESQIGRRMDTLERKYLAIDSGQTKR